MKMFALVAIKYDGAVRLPSDEKPFTAKKDDVKMLREGGFARPAEDAPAKPSKPKPQEVKVALVETILPALTPEEWGADKKPNVDLLKGKLADHFDQSAALSAAERDDAVQEYKTNNPNLFDDGAGGA